MIIDLRNIGSVILIFILGICKVSSQETPPIPVTVEVSTSRFLNFGTFIVGDIGGTVTVSDQSIRSVTGSVIPLSIGAVESSALFDIYVNPGSVINITHSPSFDLSGTSGQTIKLAIDSYSTGKTFVTTNNADIPTPVYIGGTITVGNEAANGPGQYNGTFTITFNQE